ncbi:hypothetical protein G3A56_02500 [Rhizobium oryzihabitans]|uniref:Uncharacterized protein n=1 Tax=Rhizobium oryzihabitans TaxID=2267833 RepID=A0A7L5BDV3_9HYPH|nr:hypothetical protein [Rhizobium oryzihabitans]QIB37002.1 hypothetical protein G3A56_02500 [Rhizobium oryzihabitans]
MTQLDLFTWADNKPSNVIDSRWRFERKVEALVRSMLDGRMPPQINGQVITHAFRRERNVA